MEGKERWEREQLVAIEDKKNQWVEIVAWKEN